LNRIFESIECPHNKVVLWRGANPKPKVGIQNANAPGKNHGTNYEGVHDNLH
jgi:hypothetical protein